MAILDLTEIKTRLTVFALPILGGAVCAAYSTAHPTTVPLEAGIPAIIAAVAGIASNLFASDVWEGLKKRGRARDILENEHLTRVVGLTIAALIDEAAADPRFAAHSKKLEAIARYVKYNWKKVPVRHDAEFADVSGYKLPIFLIGDANSFLKVTALTPETWEFLLNGLVHSPKSACAIPVGIG